MAYTPSRSVVGSGSGDSSARSSASFRSFLTPAAISSSSLVGHVGVLAQPRPEALDRVGFAHSSNISFGT